MNLGSYMMNVNGFIIGGELIMNKIIYVVAVSCVFSLHSLHAMEALQEKQKQQVDAAKKANEKLEELKKEKVKRQVKKQAEEAAAEATRWEEEAAERQDKEEKLINRLISNRVDLWTTAANSVLQLMSPNALQKLKDEETALRGELSALGASIPDAQKLFKDACKQFTEDDFTTSKMVESIRSESNWNKAVSAAENSMVSCNKSIDLLKSDDFYPYAKERLLGIKQIMYDALLNKNPNVEQKKALPSIEHLLNYGK